MDKQPKHPIDRGAPASVIADKFGGLVEFAKALSEARGTPVAPSTVHRWLVRGYIDNKHHDLVNAAATLRRVRIKPTDYIDTRATEAARLASAPATAGATA